MKRSFLFLIMAIFFFWLSQQTVSATISVSLLNSYQVTYVPSWAVDYSLWKLLIHNSDDDYSIKWIVIRNSGNNNDSNIIVALKQNWLFVSEYFRLNYGTSRQDTKICFKDPILINKWWQATLDIVGSFRGNNEQFNLNLVSIDGWFLNSWFDIWSFNTTTYNKSVMEFSYTGNILDSCNANFLAIIPEVPKTKQEIIRDEVIDTVNKLESCKEKYGNNATLSEQWTCICKTWGYELWGYNVCISENKDYSEQAKPLVVTPISYSYEKTVKEFKKSKLLKVDTTFKAWTEVIIYKLISHGKGGTRDVYIAKVKVWKGGKVTYRLKSHGKYKIIQ